MIGNQVQAIAMLPALSMQQLQQLLQEQNPTVPSYAVMAELSARKKQMTAMAGAGKPPVTSTVKQDMMGIRSIAPPPQMQAPQAPPQQMAQAPMAQEAPQGMAEGGLTGFADDYSNDYNTAIDALGYNPLGRSAKRYFEDPNRKPLFDMAMDKIGGMFTPGPAAPATAQPAPYLSQGIRAAGPPVYHVGKMPPDKSAPKTGHVGARMSSKTGGSSVVPPAAPYVPNEIKFGSMEEAMKSIPKDSSIADYIASIKASDTSAKDKSQAIGEAFVRWGSTLASTPGSPIGALASSAGAGLTSLQYSNRQIKAEENERRKELGVASIAQGRQDLERYGIGRATLKDQADLMRANETARFNASHLNLQDVMNQRTNAAHLQGQQIAAQAHIAAGGGSEMKLILGAAKLRHDAATEAKNLADKNYAFIGKPQEKQAYIDDYVAKAFKASPHLLPYANLDMYSQQQAPGLTATPMGQQRTLPP